MLGFLNTASLSASLKRWRTALLGDDTAGLAPGAEPGSLEQRWIEQMAAAGWQARHVTPGRDSAIWLLAEKGPTRCLVLYTLRDRPMSERSLREVIAARARLRATHAAVICAAGIAAPARPVARAEAITLLRPSDLPRLDRALGLG